MLLPDFGTFLVALRSIGTAATLAGAGVYLHRKRVIDASNKKALALFASKLAIPALFFTKIVDCPQSGCPNVFDHFRDTWILFIWPLYVVGWGVLVGQVFVRLFNTPKCQRKCVLASCAFGNSMGLPITFIAVIQTNYSRSSSSGETFEQSIDPNFYISLYFILYNALLWGVGGWLLAPTEEQKIEEESENETEKLKLSPQPVKGLRANNEEIPPNMYFSASSTDYVKYTNKQGLSEATISDGDLELVQKLSDCNFQKNTQQNVMEDKQQHISQDMHRIQGLSSVLETLSKMLSRVLQPPVVGASLGLLVAAIVPLRGLFVRVDENGSNAPLEWIFDGIRKLGQAAVPLTMAILGANLSIASKAKTTDTSFSSQTMVIVIIVKMIVMPSVGIISVFFLKFYLLEVPENIQFLFYLVLMLVTITPTANQLVVMAELSDSATKEGLAKILGWQYACAPVVLSATLMVALRVADSKLEQNRYQ